MAFTGIGSQFAQPPVKTSQQLQQELDEAERIAATLREQLAQAKWREEYDETQPAG